MSAIVSNNQTCSLPLTVLDFLRNFTEPELENVWPCEVRLYWLSLQPFVKTVRFLIGYVTPLVILLGNVLLIYHVHACTLARTHAHSEKHTYLYVQRESDRTDSVSNTRRSCLTGVILNSISFGVLTKAVFPDSSLSLYLRVLAISDNGALIFNYAVGVAKSHFTLVNDVFMVRRQTGCWPRLANRRRVLHSCALFLFAE